MPLVPVIAKYNARVDAVNSLLCVGLDSAPERIPERFQREESPQFAFNRWIIEQTHPYTSAYKPNIAFYEAAGEAGLHALALTLDYLRAEHPAILTICDAKRADIGSTNAGYVTAIFDRLGFDAVTLHPYLGQEALAPFLSRADKGCIVLCRTSNPGAGELQDLDVGGKPLWQAVAEAVRDAWNAQGQLHAGRRRDLPGGAAPGARPGGGYAPPGAGPGRAGRGRRGDRPRRAGQPGARPDPQLRARDHLRERPGPGCPRIAG